MALILLFYLLFMFIERGPSTNGQCSNIIRPPPSSPPFYKGGIDFLKFGNKVGDERLFLKSEGLG